MSDTTDIVAELERWIVGRRGSFDDMRETLQRAVNEIVRLRTLYAVADREARDYSAEIVELRARMSHKANYGTCGNQNNGEPV